MFETNNRHARAVHLVKTSNRHIQHSNIFQVMNVKPKRQPYEVVVDGVIGPPSNFNFETLAQTECNCRKPANKTVMKDCLFSSKLYHHINLL